MRKEEYFSKKGYTVTEDGHLMSPQNKIVGTHPNKKGRRYEYVSVLYKGKIDKLFAHRLQAFQKYGEEMYKEGIVVRHLNGNSLDNSFNNIAIGTNVDNALDIPKEKRKEMSVVANKASMRKIIKYDQNIVDKAVYMRKQGMSYAKIAKALGISTKSQAIYIVKIRGGCLV